jgi:RNA polymerase sigma factor (sigma-70 family)
MTGHPLSPTAFDELWREREPALRRQAAVLFDDPRLRPAPSPDDLLRDVKPAVLARWPAEPPGEPAKWVLTEVTGELLACGWTLYDGPLRGMIRRKVWSDTEVDELLQGAATRSVERLAELVCRPRPLFGWLRMLLNQQRAEWLRRGGSRKPTTVALGEFPDPIDTGTTPTQAELRARVRDMYDQVLARLAADDVHLLRLNTEQGLGPAEIARLLGITELNARQRVFRARCAAALMWQNLYPAAASELAAFGVFPPKTVSS